MNYLKILNNIPKTNVYEKITSILLVVLLYVGSMKGIQGFVATGDIFELYFPHFVQVLHNVSNFVFIGYDQYTHGGGSEFFLRPNVGSYNPLYILLGLFYALFPSVEAIYLFKASYIFSSYIALYYLQLIARRYLQYGKEMSLLFATIYVFFPVLNAYTGFTPFYMAATWIPIVIYYNIRAYEDYESLKLKLIAISLSVSYLLIGYLPLQLAGYVVIVFFISGLAFFKRERCWENVKRAGVVSTIPILLVSPLYFAYSSYHQLTNISSISSIKDVAWVGSINFQDLFSWTTNNNFEPGIISFGVIPTAIILYVVIDSIFSKRPIKIEPFIKAAILVYVTYLLILFGNEVVASDLFYYFIPIFGKMHIYVRYMIVFHLFFVLISIYFLNFIISKESNSVILKWFVISLTFIFIVLVMLTNGNSNIPSKYFYFYNASIPSLFLVLMSFYVYLISSNKVIKIYVTLAAFLLIVLNGVYDNNKSRTEHYNKTIDNQSIVYDSNALSTFVNFIERNSNGKKTIRYINFDSRTHPYISHNLPWILSDRIKILSPTGYEPHLSRDRKFAQIIPWYGNILPSYVLNFKPDFIVVSQSDLQKLSYLKSYIDTKNFLTLSDNKIVYKLNFHNDKNLANIAKQVFPNKRAVIKSEEFFSLLEFSNEEFNNKIFAHRNSNLDHIFPKRMFDGWSIDPVTGIVYDGAGRLTNFYHILESKNGYTEVFNNGIIKISTPEKSKFDPIVQVHNANIGNVKLNISSKTDVKLEYLAWGNDNLSILVNNKKEVFKLKDFHYSVDIPSGDYYIEIQYNNILIQLFIFLMGLLIIVNFFVLFINPLKARFL